MSCRHSLANGTCTECYPDTGTYTPQGQGDSLDGPGAVSAAPFTILIIGNTHQDCRGFLGLGSEDTQNDPYLRVPDDVWPPDVKATAKLHTVDESLDNAEVHEDLPYDLIIITRRACRLLSPIYCTNALGRYARKIYRDDR